MRGLSRNSKSLNFFPPELIAEVSSFLGTNNGRLAFGQTSRNIRFATTRLDPRIKVIPRFSCVISGHQEEISCAVSTPDGKIITGSLDETAKVWDSRGQLLFSLEGHEAEIGCVAVAEDGRIITGSWDNTVKIWSQEGQLLATLTGHTASVTSVAVTSNGKIITGGSDALINVWTLEGELLFSRQINAAQISDLVLVNDQKVVIGFRTGEMAIFDIETYKVMYLFQAHKNEFSSVIALPNGNILTNSYGEELKIWNSEQGILLKEIHFPEEAHCIQSIALTHEGLIAAQFTNKKLKIFNLDFEMIAECECDAEFLINGNKGVIFLNQSSDFEDSEDSETIDDRGIISFQIFQF